MPDIFFTEKGEGYPVLFIHGFCETQAMWESFKEPFASHYKTIAIDLPGFGKSPLPDGDFSIANIAEQVLQLLDHLKIEETIVIAHSLGGYVTLEMAKKQPSRFAGFSLFHSTAQADNEEKVASRNKTIEFVEKRGVEVFATSFIPSLFYQKNRKGLVSEIDEIVALAAKTPLATLIQYTKAMRDRNDRTDLLKTFDNPISIIAGDKDTSVPVERIAEQELLPKHGVINILENTGHMGMFEQKEKTTEY